MNYIHKISRIIFTKKSSNATHVILREAHSRMGAEVEITHDELHKLYEIEKEAK